MIDSNIIEQQTFDSDDVLDMSSQILTYDFDSVDIIAAFEISEQYEMRVDILSFAAYGTTEYVDLICRFNGIDNPFSVKTGQILLMPDITSLNSQATYKTLKPIQLQKKKLVSLSEVETSIQENKNSATSTPSKKENPAPNYIKTDNGVIIF